MYNRILTDADRVKYEGLIDDMKVVLPDMMSRKIDRANVQQAFMVDLVSSKAHKTSKILCVGSFEDTAYEYLKAKEWNIIGICPEYDYDIHSYMQTDHPLFDIVFSTSVLEHVANDEEFVEDMCKLLELNGIGVLTFDFNDSYIPNNRFSKKPSVDERLYTSRDYARLGKIMAKYNCFFMDEFRIDSQPDFEYEGAKYSFATAVFKKIR